MRADESAHSSQQLEAIRRVAGYPREVVAWFGAEPDPAVLGIRLLPLNVQGILISSYSELDAVVYVASDCAFIHYSERA